MKILTGDNDRVTQHVCGQVGIAHDDLVTGDDVARMDDAALGHVAERASVFARMSPAQKNRVILALMRRGHVVGFIGDGINDAPSLHAADIGISVMTAVDVARESADVILGRTGLRQLHRGILEGRRASGNLMKYLLMGTSSNFGNMFSMAAAAAFLPFLPMLPTQILLNNLLYDLAQLTIPTDHVDREYLSAPRRWDMGLVRDFMLFVGPVSSAFDFLTFYVLLHYLHATETLFHTGWFVESLATQTLVLFVIRTTGSAFASRPSAALTATTLAAVGVGLLLPASPLASVLGFTVPPIALFRVPHHGDDELSAARRSRQAGSCAAPSSLTRLSSGIQTGSEPRQPDHSGRHLRTGNRGRPSGLQADERSSPAARSWPRRPTGFIRATTIGADLPDSRPTSVTRRFRGRRWPRRTRRTCRRVT